MTANVPLKHLLCAVDGLVKRQQAQAVDYLADEDRVLKEQLGRKRLRLTGDQRRRLAAPGRAASWSGKQRGRDREIFTTRRALRRRSARAAVPVARVRIVALLAV